MNVWDILLMVVVRQVVELVVKGVSLAARWLWSLLTKRDHRARADEKKEQEKQAEKKDGTPER